MLHQLIPSTSVAIHQCLSVGVIATGSTFDHVTGQRERGSRKADQRHVRWQVVPRLRNGIHHKLQFIVGLERLDAINVGRGSHGIVNHRPIAFDKFQVTAHRDENW